MNIIINYLTKKFLHLKKFINFFYIKHVFLPIQLLFSWLLFKILGFFGWGLLYKIFVSIVFFLFLSGLLLFPYIFNNFFFQFFVFLFYVLINFLLQFNNGCRIFYFIIGMFSCFFFPHKFFLESLNLEVFLPNLNFLLLLVFLLQFFRKFNENVIILALSRGSIESLTLKDSFCWIDIVNLETNFFFLSFSVQNKELYFEKFPLNYFPFSPNDLKLLHSMSLDEPKRLFFEAIKKLKKDPNNAKEINEIYYEQFTLKVIEKQKIIDRIVVNIRLNNSTIFSHSFQGLVISYLTLFVVYNF